MKAIYLLLILVLFTSCEYSIENVNDPDVITSVEMAREIEKDTTEYKVLKKDSTIYLINKHTNKISKQINISTESTIIICMIACLIIVLSFIIGYIKGQGQS